MHTDNIYLAEQKIGKLLLKFSIPCILSLVISALYNIVDQIFIGNSRVGMFGIAATTVVFPLTIIAQAFAWMFGDGTAAFMSIEQGESPENISPEMRKKSRLSRAVGSSLVMTILCSVIILAIAFPLKVPILNLFGASENSLDLAVDYFNIVVAFFPVFMLMNMLSGVVRADGSPRYAMAASVAGAVINIAFDPIFIYACDWGIKGAAWATVMGQAVSLIIFAVYLLRSRMFRLSLKAFIPNFRLIWSCMRLGISSFINQIAIDATTIALNILLAKYGAISAYGQDIPIAIIGIETKVFTIVNSIIIGIVLGGQPIVGYNYGAGRFDRVRKCYRDILISTLIVGAVATILFEACPEGIISIFGTTIDSADYDKTLYIQYGVYTLRIFLSLIIFTGVIKMSSVFFQAVGKPVSAMIASLIRDIITFIPLVIILPYVAEIYKPGTGVEALLFAAPGADILGIIVCVILSVIIFRGMKREEMEYNADHARAAAHAAAEHAGGGNTVMSNASMEYPGLETSAAADESGIPNVDAETNTDCENGLRKDS